MRTLDYIVKPVRTAAILTNSYVAGTVLTELSSLNQLVLLIQFTKGSLTSAEYKIEFSPDNTTWYQETASSIAAGTSTDTLLEHTTTATGNLRVPIELKDRYVRISVKGTGTVTSSSMTVDAIVGTSAN